MHSQCTEGQCHIDDTSFAEYRLESMIDTTMPGRKKKKERGAVGGSFLRFGEYVRFSLLCHAGP